MNNADLRSHRELKVLPWGRFDGPTNMAFDQAMLELAAQTNQAWLRFYGWDPPTLSLGYFQSHTERNRHPSSQMLSWVRRSSGGGALIHHHELTYSIALPSVLASKWRPEGLYGAIHGSLTDTLSRQSIFLRRFGDVQVAHHEADLSESAQSIKQEPFLCFQRRTPEDLVLGDSKIVGSAQRRLQGSVLVHGGILLAKSEYAPELHGILEISGRDLSPKSLASTWVPQLSQTLQLAISEVSRVPLEMKERIADIRLKRFAALEWNEKR